MSLSVLKLARISVQNAVLDIYEKVEIIGMPLDFKWPFGRKHLIFILWDNGMRNLRVDGFFSMMSFVKTVPQHRLTEQTL